MGVCLGTIEDDVLSKMQDEKKGEKKNAKQDISLGDTPSIVTNVSYE